jgi:hypothetical protein
VNKDTGSLALEPVWLVILGLAELVLVLLASLDTALVQRLGPVLHLPDRVGLVGKDIQCR